MNLDSFKNKKILYISIKTFNYELEIANKLRELGAKVDYFDERPSNSVLTKGIIRLKRSFIQKKIDTYYKSILKKIEGEKYDFFFLVKGEAIPSFFLAKLKLLQKDCFFIYSMEYFGLNLFWPDRYGCFAFARVLGSFIGPLQQHFFRIQDSNFNR